MSPLASYCVGSGFLGSDRVELCYGVCECVCLCVPESKTVCYAMLCCGYGDVVVACGSVSL